MADKLPVGDTIDNLKTDGQKLVQDSKALVTAEIKPAAKHAGIGVGMFGGAGYFGIVGALLLWLCGAFAFSLMWQHIGNWDILLSLVVGFATMAVVLFILAGILALVARDRSLRSRPRPASLTRLNQLSQRSSRPSPVVSTTPLPAAASAPAKFLLLPLRWRLTGLPLPAALAVRPSATELTITALPQLCGRAVAYDVAIKARNPHLKECRSASSPPADVEPLNILPESPPCAPDPTAGTIRRDRAKRREHGQ